MIIDRLFLFVKRRRWWLWRRGTKNKKYNNNSSSCSNVASSVVSRMDATSRRVLQSAVQEETDEIAIEYESVQQEYATLQQQYETACEKERFVGMRLESYRKALQERECALLHKKQKHHQQQQAEPLDLQQQSHDDAAAVDVDVDDAQTDKDLERNKNNDSNIILLQRQADFINSQEQQLTRDREALDQIKITYKEMLVNCETMRRRMRQLEIKIKKMESMTQDCHDFLKAAAQQEERSHCAEGEEEEEEMVAVNDDDDDDDEEMATRTSSIADNNIEKAESKEDIVNESPLVAEEKSG